jgi:hypothetical protein
MVREDEDGAEKERYDAKWTRREQRRKEDGAQRKKMVLRGRKWCT